MKTLIKTMMTALILFSFAACSSSDSDTSDDTDSSADSSTVSVNYAVVDTGQTKCYDNDGLGITCPSEGEALSGQDAQYAGNQPGYTDNGDGTVTDKVTGLMWQQVPVDNGYSYQDAADYCESLELAGYDDWRIPTTKELFSISDFSQGWPYLDTAYFSLAGSSVSKDEQYWTEKYVGTTAEGQSNAAFGVNHGTGHIKAYPAGVSGPMGNYVRAVRGNSYGVNDFVDNGDGTVSDNATGVMWQQADSGSGLDWEAALAYAENSTLAGYDDWRLPNVKELQSILDYTHSPSASDAADLGPAIDTDYFSITELPSGTTNYDTDYGYFWTGTSAYFGGNSLEYYYAWYVAFGTAVDDSGTDSHGAGGVRFDTKVEGGPLGEGGERYYNYVRLVRGGNVEQSAGDDPVASDSTDTSDDQTDEQPDAPVDPADAPDLSAAAAILGVSEAQLQEALGDPAQGQPDFAAAAVQLGVTEQELMDALAASTTDADTGNDTNDTSSNEDEEVTSADITYPIVDTNQGLCYDNSELIDAPAEGEAFYGQDAQYTGATPSYTDNGDGTITDNVTGLIWTQDISSYAMPWSDASGYCESLTTGGYTGWRLPTVKELWSVRDFSQGWPWVDTDYFYLVGDGSDLAQHHSWTSNPYLVESEYQNEQVQGDPAFIVNDWTGHIKAMSGSRFVRAVRGNTSYGTNDFVDNGDGTVSDNATGLMWEQDDNGEAINWEDALSYAEAATTAGYDDWRLPNAKELQSIADYSGAFPAIDTSVFNLTELTNIIGQTDYPFYWSSTSNPYIEAYHEETDDTDSDSDYVPGHTYAWILAVGYCPDMDGYDLHGAGAVVFDTKAEEVSDGSGIEVFYHHVRLVRGGDVTETPDGDPTTVNPDRVVEFEEGDMGNGGGNTPPGDGDTTAPDLATAAAILGVTEAELMDVLGDPAQGQPDIAAAAAQLGVTEQELVDALDAS